MNFRAEKEKCGEDGIFEAGGLDNWPDGEGGLMSVDKCRLSGSRCDAYHCCKRNTHADSHFDALDAVGLTEAYREEMA